MTKIDLKKQYKSLYQPSGKCVVEVDVPSLAYLMVDGVGDPNQSQSFQNAIEALYSLSYTLKFAIKKGARAIDYGVMPLEGLWWADDPKDFLFSCKAAWKWTLMIMQPEFVTPQDVEAAITEVRKKKDPASLDLVRFETLHEGCAAQILYTGPFADEGPTIQRIHEFIHASDRQLYGKHHEIYLSDMRRTAPEKLKTVLRQPMR
jgi:hypothetical protein